MNPSSPLAIPNSRCFRNSPKISANFTLSGCPEISRIIRRINYRYYITMPHYRQAVAKAKNVTLFNPVFEVWHKIVLPFQKSEEKALRHKHFFSQKRYIYISMSRFWKKNLLQCNQIFREPRLPNINTLPPSKSGAKSVTCSSLISSLTDEWWRIIQRFEGSRSHRKFLCYRGLGDSQQARNRPFPPERKWVVFAFCTYKCIACTVTNIKPFQGLSNLLGSELPVHHGNQGNSEEDIKGDADVQNTEYLSE